MLESEKDLICCGTIIVGGEGTELYWNPRTGAVCYENSIDGSTMMVGECSVSGAMEITQAASDAYFDGLAKNKYADAIGIIVCDDGTIVAIISDTKAEIRDLLKATEHSDNVLDIDLNIIYDEAECCGDEG